MPLLFGDFAHYYEGRSLSDAQSRAHFDAFADLMECVARLFWCESKSPNELGITLDDDTLGLTSQVESARPITAPFNEATRDAARKKEP